MEKIFQKPKGLNDKIMHYCPGCGHGIVHKMIAQTLEELDLLERTIFISPVGCAVFAYWYFNTDHIQAAHGRAPAVATGLKRANPELIIVSYQGDGDLASAGTAEIVHAAARGENISVIFINNAVYGMTGGQMAPTTLVGQKTSTSPFGRDPNFAGHPLKVCEMLATTKAPRYIERTSLDSVANLHKTKKAIKKSFDLQARGEGFSLVEILSPCPTNWGMSPPEAMDWIAGTLSKEYPLGVFRDERADSEVKNDS
jgi:2-oxoglutarate ferredoxin oxidoreductase subunit beta